MSFEEKTILKIKRQFSQTEKYRLLLRHLTNMEVQLAKERRKNTDLLKEEFEYREDIKALQECNVVLQQRLDEYVQGDLHHVKFVRVKTHQRMVVQKQKFEKLYWELHQEYETLKKQLQNR